MTASGLVLLAGLFGAPMALLWLGHRLRDRGRRARGAFWGGVIGHSAGLLISLTAAVAPPIWWAGGPILRDLSVHAAPLVLALAGAAIGAARGHRRREPVRV